MKKFYLLEYLKRGALFAGLGPIILGIVYAIIDASLSSFSLGGSEVLIAIISTYILAFVQAGASVFNEIDSWSVAKSLACHFSTIYVAYILCYVVNSWIPFEPIVILIFTAVFIAAYFIIWLTVYLIIKKTSQKCNATLSKETLNNNI